MSQVVLMGLAAFTGITLGQGTDEVQPIPPEPKTSAVQDDLSDRLIRKALTGSDEQLLDTALRMMEETAHALEIDFDPGLNTLTRQDRIVELLDEAIQRSAMQRRQQSGSNSVVPSDRRSMPRGSRPRGGGNSDNAGDTASQSGPGTDSAETSPSAETSKERGQLRDLRRSWGHLPPRARDELIQGFNEEFVERYREWVERYYQALQEKGE